MFLKTSSAISGFSCGALCPFASVRASKKTAAVCTTLRELKPAFMISLLECCAPREGLQACYRSGSFLVKLNALPRTAQSEAAAGRRRHKDRRVYLVLHEGLFP